MNCLLVTEHARTHEPANVPPELLSEIVVVLQVSGIATCNTHSLLHCSPQSSEHRPVWKHQQYPEVTAAFTGYPWVLNAMLGNDNHCYVLACVRMLTVTVSLVVVFDSRPLPVLESCAMPSLLPASASNQSLMQLTLPAVAHFQMG